MNNSNKALSFEQARNLLPNEFRPNAELTGRKKLLNTPMGLIAYHYSSLLKDGLWKTSHNEDEIRNTVDYILFAIGFEGMLLLSREVLLSFYEKTTKADFLMTVIRYMFIRKQTNTIGKERTAKEWILPDTSSRMNKI